MAIAYRRKGETEEWDLLVLTIASTVCRGSLPSQTYCSLAKETPRWAARQTICLTVRIVPEAHRDLT